MNLKTGGNSLKIYQEENGNSPFENWLESIKDIVLQARIINRLRRIEIGNLGDHKFLGEGVFELRLYFGSGFRIYLGRAGSCMVVLLIGGNKKTQKKDIQKAKQFWRDYKINN